MNAIAAYKSFSVQYLEVLEETMCLYGPIIYCRMCPYSNTVFGFTVNRIVDEVNFFMYMHVYIA